MIFETFRLFLKHPIPSYSLSLHPRRKQDLKFTPPTLSGTDCSIELRTCASYELKGMAQPEDAEYESITV